MTIVSTQDRVISGVTFALAPLTLAAIFAAFKKPKLSATFAGLGIAAGAIGAIGAGWFVPRNGPSPLLAKGWVNGTPTADSIQTQMLLADANKSIKAAGGYEYSDQALNGIGGFWRPT